MSYTHAERKNRAITSETARRQSAAPGPSQEALRSGAAKPSAEQLGRRVDLPDAMRAKMENAFGTDLSAVKLYESQAVADAGAQAVTQGSSIAFAPGMLDFSSFGGQSLLGHELSHVVSQSRGEVTGGGFLNDHALEARAGQEGAMAAAGQQIAMPAAAMSAVSAAPAAGPMQAKKGNKDEGDELEAARSMAAVRESYKTMDDTRFLMEHAPGNQQAAALHGQAQGIFDQAVASAPKATDKMLANGISGQRESFKRKLAMYHGEHSDLSREQAVADMTATPTGKNLLRDINIQRAMKASRKGKAFTPLTSIPGF